MHKQFEEELIMFLCYDRVDYGTERDTTDYSLDGMSLIVHTHTLNRNRNKNININTHRQWSCQLTADAVNELLSMTEEQRLRYLLRHQSKLHRSAIYDKEI